MIKLPDNWYFVKKRTYFDFKNETRYCLTAHKHGKKNRKTLVAFMMNPSNAGRRFVNNKASYVFSSKRSDDTINLLIKSFGDEYQRIVIFNNIPKIEPQSKNFSFNKNIKKDTEFKIENFKTIKKFVDGRRYSYDMYVGTGTKGSNGNDFIKSAFNENMNLFSFTIRCNKIFISGLNDSGTPKHPKSQGIGYDVSSFLLKSRRRVSWANNEFTFL